VAARLFRQAADQGDALGQHALGDSYMQGKGVTSDQTRAAKLFKQAADQGLARAQSSFGQYCTLGLGVVHDIAEAARYFHPYACTVPLRRSASRGRW